MKEPRRTLRFSLLLLLSAAFFQEPVHAWEDHTLGAYPALEVMPDVRNAPPVRAEPFEQFLKAEQKGLVALLEEEEVWDRQHIPNYPPLPAALELRAGGSPEDLRTRFLEALRVNPTVLQPLFVQLLPGDDLAGRTPLPWHAVTILKDPGTLAEHLLVALQPGEQVSVLQVVATASDEPDYGYDLELWADNGSAYSKLYGLGEQPYGNPVEEFSSQAPFHMGFYHEAGIVYRLASALGRTYPEYRLHQYQSLARFAFKTGHEYWGWRFAGWGLHYIQDLTQPYHATVQPGLSVARMLWINTLATVGIHGLKDRAVQLVTNRHLALEYYEYDCLSASLQAHQLDEPTIKALADTRADSNYPSYSAASPRDVITAESHGRAEETDATLARWLPKRLVSDPKYLFGKTEPDINVLKIVQAGSPKARLAMDKMLEHLMRSFGAHSRSYLRAIRGEGSHS